MYRPNFCAQCGAKILRLRWHLWTSRKFCADCARQLRRERFVPLVTAAAILVGAGYIGGRSGRPEPPPLTIVRRADSPLNGPEETGNPNSQTTMKAPGVDTVSAADEVYLCGARTKKGTPCSRRVQKPARCWQHKGAPAMLPQEKLLVKG